MGILSEKLERMFSGVNIVLTKETLETIKELISTITVGTFIQSTSFNNCFVHVHSNRALISITGVTVFVVPTGLIKSLTEYHRVAHIPNVAKTKQFDRTRIPLILLIQCILLYETGVFL